MKKQYFLTVFVALIFLSAINGYSEINDIYCHFTLVEGDVYIFKSNKDQAVKAVINHPLIQGDIVYTNGNGRCELQFNNGTIMRMNNHTELQLTTVLSPSLTSNKKITTLHLNKGQVFSMNQIYKREIFQLITPATSIKMNARSTNSVLVNKKSHTHIYVMRGKVGVLYDENPQTLKHESIRAGNGYWFKENKMIPEHKKMSADFMLWNEKINTNFKDLHYGKSKIPPVIYRRSPGIVHFAERFSTRFGSWEYNELFGYVWKPADFVFQDKRPFFDANYVEINGELILVPNQPWGWAPANLGTWFWTKTQGWIWIPGDAFSPGIYTIGLRNHICCNWWGVLYWSNPYWWITDSIHNRIYNFHLLYGNICCMPNYWIMRVFGNSELYRIYRTGGVRAWRQAYLKTFKQKPLFKKPNYKNIPRNIKPILTRINKLPLQKVENYFAKNRPDSFKHIHPIQIKSLNNRINKENLPGFLKAKINRISNDAKPVNNHLSLYKKDWNPDARWSRRNGIDIFYSTKKNEVVCPELKIGSRSINSFQKNQLRRSVMTRHSSASVTPVCTSSSSSSNTTTSSTAKQSSSSRSSQSSSGNGKK